RLRSMIHTVRTSRWRLSSVCADSQPSATYFSPWTEWAFSTTSPFTARVRSAAMRRSGSSIEKPTDSKNRALVGMSGVHQVVNDLLSLDYSEMSIAKPHGVSSLSHHDAYPAQRSSPLPRGRGAQLPSTTGAFAHLGDEIPADKLEERLVRHLRR